MANEIPFGWEPGNILTANIYKADGTNRDLLVSMPETNVGVSGVYIGSSTLVEAGDLVLIDDGIDKIGFAVYQPDVTIAGGSITAAEIVDALMADTRFTAGGAMTYEVLLKILAAWSAGKWQLKTGTTDTYQLLDASDGTTVVMEIVLSQTSPYKTVTIV